MQNLINPTIHTSINFNQDSVSLQRDTHEDKNKQNLTRSMPNPTDPAAATLNAENSIARVKRDAERTRKNFGLVQTMYVNAAPEHAKDKASTLASLTEVEDFAGEPYVLIDTRLPETRPDLYRQYLQHCVENIDTLLNEALAPPPLQVNKTVLGDGIALHVQNPPETALGTHKYYLGLNTLRIYREQIAAMLQKPDAQLTSLHSASEYTSGNAASANAYFLSLANLPPLLATFGVDVTDQMVKNMEAMGAICTRAPEVKDGNWVPVLESSRNPNGVDIDDLHEHFPTPAYGQFLENVQTINGGKYPDMIVLPMGSGQLLKNLLDKLTMELKDPAMRPAGFKPIVLVATWAPPGQYLINKISGESTATREKMMDIIDMLKHAGVLHAQSGFRQVSDDNGMQGKNIGKEALDLTSEPAAGTATKVLFDLFNDLEIKAHSKNPLLIHTGQGNHREGAPFSSLALTETETWRYAQEAEGTQTGQAFNRSN